MKILALTQRNSGCGYHRVVLPVALMDGKTKARITDTITEGLLEEGWDIVYVNRDWQKNDLLVLRERYGFKLVVDIDDYWILDHHHLLYDDYNFSNFAARVVRHLRGADLCVTTHDRLADMVRQYNSNVIICPNAIPYGELQFNDTVIASDAVKFFWAGGITHEADLRLLKEPVSRLGGNIHMVLGGYADSNLTEQYYWGRMLNHFTNEQKHPHTILPGRDVFRYYELFELADVMLVPLQKTMFNQYKSNLKILEAAGKRIPVIASATHPYLGFPTDCVLYAKDSAQWLRHMERLRDSETLRMEYGERLRAYCDKHFNFHEINKVRYEALAQLLQPV